VNTFDERRIANLFSDFRIETISFVGSTRSRTNWLSAALMDFAGNPYGDYQGAICGQCGQPKNAPTRSPVQLVATKCAHWLRKLTEAFASPRPMWIHVLLSKAGTMPATGATISSGRTAH
jgi:hypothetical protein